MTYRIMIQVIGDYFESLSFFSCYTESTNRNKSSEFYAVPGTTFTPEHVCQAYVVKRWKL